MSIITAVDVIDVRFPTSQSMDGSDAMNKDGDYSAAYVILRTDEPGLSGFGFTFTIGRGNDICVLAAQQRAQPLIGRTVLDLVSDLGGIYRELKSDSQLRWLGPEKGVEHLAMAAVMNALWDLAARHSGKPLWLLLADMSPRQIVDAADLTYLSDALTRGEALAMLEELAPTRAERIAKLEVTGYPCYTTSAGWLGYSDEKLRLLCQEAVDAGFTHIKLKVGANKDDDIRRLGIARSVIGYETNLMIDANQVWDVPEAIERIAALAEFKPLWIEEPTSPDDVLGHAAVRKAVAPIGVATGEHGMNRVLFKQMFQAEAIDYCQVDAARLASINELLAVYFMAKKFGVPVCPHAGGVGLCELVQHLSIFDYVAVSGTLEDRVTEYVDHLHEHFVEPCIVKNGAYVVPTQPGYSAEMYETTLNAYAFPHGTYWASVQDLR
ncbi:MULTISPECIES: L-fuconate dehydratase [Cryobacterium]|uniref:L-fuconate dehydratase n=1 Tax=Cryobacterium breve TaxID=1259258 RepID=A0ABY2J055_9MICO|nr:MULTISPECIES: L-fuconate dehydratase [Cryobacterium]TFC91783.1 L-fuconate dehydratase [Cryobacterium sp. TmT3-12]TFC98333.1 L-fuconate dehydratase [Cryobacterium breve]